MYFGEWLFGGILHCGGQSVKIYHVTLFGKFYSIKRPCLCWCCKPDACALCGRRHRPVTWDCSAKRDAAKSEGA